MNLFQITILTGLLGNTSVGVFVLLANPKRHINITFFVLTTLMALWLAAMLASTMTTDDALILFWIRQTAAFAGLIPVGVYILQYAIMHAVPRMPDLIYELRFWLLASFLVFALCHSQYFALSADMPTETELLPRVTYGWGFYPFMAFFVFTILRLLMAGRGYTTTSANAQRNEVLFLQMGCVGSFVAGVSLVASSVIAEYQEIGLFVPLSVLVLDGFVAYGIATRRILAASAVLQRMAAFALMALYLAGLYMLVAWIAHQVMRWIIKDPNYLSHLLAAIALAFSVAPTHGRMQAFAHHLLPSKAPVNSDEVLKRARLIFQEVSTELDLTKNFADLLMNTFGTHSLTVLRPDANGDYRQQYPPPPRDAAPLMIRSGDLLLSLLTREGDPVTVDMLQRIRSSALVDGARQALEAAGATAAVGCCLHKKIKALLLLTARETGRIYDRNDQRILQILCDHFAVAIENANLYTAVQNAKIYNDILLDSLTSGIVAVNSDLTVTVFNQRAQALTGLPEAGTVGQRAEVLPDALRAGLEDVLRTRAGFRDRDTTIRSGNRDIAIRFSGEVFRSHTGQLLGALVIFTDMTELKRMEEQIRRSDRLSSIGTLSAGMAHEIKNPLVTIKTFTQLLPDQYQDPEFRQTFFDLVSQEVKRIDALVNRLLNFARPAQVTLIPLSLHEVIDGSLHLIAQQLAQKGIRLERHLDAPRHVVSADADQLNQAFVNFLLNAVDAMERGGTLTVRTSLVHFSTETPQIGGARSGPCLLLDIADTGGGIRADYLDRIFDPFFTTKAHGVGLGLSVSHGIIQEHHGAIHVESSPQSGTVFHIQFPLHTESKDEDKA
jgi:nitrogen-specific signal transduction histidine kinase